VALYGFEELFNSLPTTIKRLNIINTSNETVNIDVPDTISRFQSLTAILFENMISKLPDSICQLKNLVFLACPNNKELQTIPECIMNLPNLTFVNVSRCPNVKVPQALEQYNTGEGFYHMEE
jgi:Leucine-rich repeat (LRR) protein